VDGGIPVVSGHRLHSGLRCRGAPMPIGTVSRRPFRQGNLRTPGASAITVPMGMLRGTGQRAASVLIREVVLCDLLGASLEL
jgi:hypothetical protein